MQESIENKDDKEPNPSDNPYAYLDRTDFSSEKFKIEIKNLPKFYGIHELKKLLNKKLQLGTNKIKVPKRNSSYAFVCFRNEADRDRAIEVIANYKWKGNLLNSCKAKPAPDPLVKKRKLDDDAEDGSKKRKEDVPQEERLKLCTIPLSGFGYEEQLRMKQETIKQVLKRLCNNLMHQNSNLKSYLEQEKRVFDNLPCELLDIRSSSTIDGYRNKCEFSIGLDEETQLPTVGFRIGRYSTGFVGVAPVENLKHIPQIMKKAVLMFQDFVRSSKLQVFNTETQTGHFRQLTARTAPDQLMLVVGIHPQELSSEEVEDFKQELKNRFFFKKTEEDPVVTSLYYQEIVKKVSFQDKWKLEHLSGDTHVYDSICGLKFRISPEAFFQVNTSAAEILYNSAIELAQPCETSTIADVCCGTGTIGLCFSKFCPQVLGLEIIEQAVEDAKENAKLNSVDNCEFFCGKAEDIVNSVLHRAKNEEVIAVVDPPRAGLHHRAVLQLRKSNKIDKLIYISCDAAAAMKNFIDLGRPESKTVYGDPFVPTKAVAVDLFPHTKHCELVICFERWQKVKNKQETQEKST